MSNVIKLSEVISYRANREQLEIIEKMKERFPTNLAMASLVGAYYGTLKLNTITDEDKEQQLQNIFKTMLRSLNIPGVESIDGYAILAGVLIQPQAFLLLKLIYRLNLKYNSPVAKNIILKHAGDELRDMVFISTIMDLTKNNFILTEERLAPCEDGIKASHYHVGEYAKLYFDMEGDRYAK